MNRGDHGEHGGKANVSSHESDCRCDYLFGQFNMKQSSVFSVVSVVNNKVSP